MALLTKDSPMLKKPSSELLSDQLWPRVREIDRGDQPVTAAFAYFSHDHLNLRIGDVLIVDASDGNVRSRSIDAGLLNSLHKQGVLIYNMPGLHAKVIRIGAYAVVGSANSSNNSEKRLTEAAVVSSDPLFKTQVTLFLEQLQAAAQQLMLEDIRRLMRIKLDPKKPTAPTSPMKLTNNPPARWWLGIGPLSDRINQSESKDVASGMQEASYLTSNSATYFDSIRWVSSAQITKRFRVGDIVFRAYSTPWGENKNTRVMCPAIILYIQRKDRWIRLYLEELIGYREKVSLSAAQKALAPLGKRTLTAKSARTLSISEIEKLTHLLEQSGIKHK
jgi:hypothetical protein